MKYKFFSLNELLEFSSKSQVRKLLKTFKCKRNLDLEQFLHQKAIIFEKKGRSRTYLYVDIDTKQVIAYFTISIASLNIEFFSNETISYLYGQENVNSKCLPCYLIGQLGKSDNCKLQIGTKLLKKSISVIIKGHNILNGRFILLDSINNAKIIKFYEKNGFIPIENIIDDKEVIKMIYWLV